MRNRTLMAAALTIAGGALFAMQPISATADAPRKASDAEVPPAREIGKPESCIDSRNIRSSHVRNDNVIDFEMNNGKMYRNTLPHGCPGLGFEEAFSYKTSISRLCSVDIITVLNNTAGRLDSGASCGLGQFQPIELIKQDKDAPAK